MSGARRLHVVAPGRGFIILYAAAFAGLFVSFIPLITVLLPLKVAAIAAPEERVALLSAAAFGGAGVASVANLLFGALSDRTYRRRGTRRPWIAWGLVLLGLSYAGFLHSHDAVTMLCAVGALQVAINMSLAPLVAIMADEVPDAQKGVVAGMLGAAQPFGSLIALGVSLRGLGSDGVRYGLLCLVIVALVLPLLLLMREREGSAHPRVVPQPARRRVDLACVWAARLLVQVAGNGLATFGLFYFLALPAGMPGQASAAALSQNIAAIFAAATLAALLLTVAAGRFSDSVMRRKPFLGVAALVMAGGLLMMALAGDWAVAALGYGVAICGMSIFLALQSALAMQLLPSPDHRGRDLGLFNLTNTLPAMIAPLLALALTPERLGFGPWLIVLAAGVLVGGATAMAVRTQR